MKRNNRWRFRPYLQSIPGILYYQMISSIIIGISLFGLKRLGAVLLLSTGHPAVTSGSFGFLFSTWQGYVLILIGLLVLCVYTVFDLNLKILYSDRILEGSRIQVRKLLRESAATFLSFRSLRGILLILFVSLLTPLIGVGLTVSLTRSLEIPDFITSVIYDTPLYLVGYFALMLFLTITAVRYLFTFHEIVLEHEKPADAMRHARQMMREHWKNFLPHFLLFSLLVVLFSLLVLILLYIGAYGVPRLFPGTEVRSFTAVFFGLCVCGVLYLLTILSQPLEILEMSRYFRMYQRGTRVYVPEQKRRLRPLRVLCILSVLLLLAAAAFALTVHFDQVFPLQSSVRVIAHRTGGTLADENTAEGIRLAAEHGAWGAETDVQRTADGAYIINHDTTFSRLYGVDARPSDLTMEEIRALRTKSGKAVPTLEELLTEAKKDGVKLFIELKGSTADRRMVDDVVRMVREKDMVGETALISLKYDVLAYAEETYPEFETGYLYFLSYGQVGKLHVDDLIIEEQLATTSMIDSIHADGKTCYVWTVNSADSMSRLLNTQADALITDEVAQAEKMKSEMKDRSMQERVMDQLMAWLF